MAKADRTKEKILNKLEKILGRGILCRPPNLSSRFYEECHRAGIEVNKELWIKLGYRFLRINPFYATLLFVNALGPESEIHQFENSVECIVNVSEALGIKLTEKQLLALGQGYKRQISKGNIDAPNASYQAVLAFRATGRDVYDEMNTELRTKCRVQLDINDSHFRRFDEFMKERGYEVLRKEAEA